jgi:hypothetical protein
MSDYSPPYTDEDAKFEKRRDKVIAETHRLSVRDLTVGELLVIVDIFSMKYGYGVSVHAVDVLSKILSQHSRKAS